MSYHEYVIAAYAVFALVLLWDFVAPHLQLRAALRAVQQRTVRATSRTTPTELER